MKKSFFLPGHQRTRRIVVVSIRARIDKEGRNVIFVNTQARINDPDVLFLQFRAVFEILSVHLVPCQTLF